METSESENRIFLGIDVGGTNVKAGVVDDSGAVLSLASLPTEAVSGPDHGVDQMVAAAHQAIRSAEISIDRISAVGLATPGTMDIPAGKLLEPPNLPGWENFPVRQRVADRLGRPTILQNDANAAAYGEYWAGSASDAASLVFFTLGTGLGGGIIIDDMIVEGEHSHGSECGHVIIEMDGGRLCPTGQYGTLEAYCSATALMKRFREAVDQGRTSSVVDRLDDVTPLSPLLMSEEAEQGDDLSTELILEMARCLGVGITTICHVIDPTIVLLGGAMTFGRHETKIGRRFLDRVREEFQARAFPVVAAKVKIDYASLGGNAGFIGAAGCARRALNRGTL
ncbi:MAG: ROK family protein [Planctomycetaceae bacterium]